MNPFIAIYSYKKIFIALNVFILLVSLVLVLKIKPYWLTKIDLILAGAKISNEYQLLENSSEIVADLKKPGVIYRILSNLSLDQTVDVGDIKVWKSADEKIVFLEIKSWDRKSGFLIAEKVYEYLVNSQRKKLIENIQLHKKFKKKLNLNTLTPKELEIFAGNLNSNKVPIEVSLTRKSIRLLKSNNGLILLKYILLTLFTLLLANFLLVLWLSEINEKKS